MSAKRADTRAAVAGLFDRPSVTGGLAGRDERPAPAAEPLAGGPEAEQDGHQDYAGRDEPERGTSAGDTPHRRGARPGGVGDEAGPVAPVPTWVRLGVELSEEETGYLRSLSRPARTGGPRTLGSKFVATGVLVAAIELLRSTEVDMRGVDAGDLAEMTGRARAALIRAALAGRAGEAS